MSDWDSAEVAVVAGLLAAGKTVTGVEVHDGLIVTASGADEVLVVAGGLDESNQSDQSYIQHQFAQPGYEDQQETVTVWCTIGVLNGSANIAATRARCYEILREFARAIEDDMTFSGAVILAWVSAAEWRPQQSPNGAVGALMVGVTAEAETSL